MRWSVEYKGRNYAVMLTKFVDVRLDLANRFYFSVKVVGPNVADVFRFDTQVEKVALSYLQEDYLLFLENVHILEDLHDLGCEIT